MTGSGNATPSAIVVKIGLAAIVAGGIAAVTLTQSHVRFRAAEEATAAVRSPSPASMPSLAAEPPLANSTAPTFPEIPTSMPVAQPVKRASPAPSPRLHGRSASAWSTTIEGETRALRAAMADLRDGHADRALASLDAQMARFPSGVLVEERTEARIIALCALGRTEEARGVAAHFLADYPRSVLAGRVRASCGGATTDR